MVRVKVDKFGRVVLPASVRRHLGVKPGGELLMHQTATGALLEPPSAAPRLKREGRLLVLDADLDEGFDWSTTDWVAQARSQRTADILQSVR